MQTNADAIAETLRTSGVEFVFGLPGGEIVALIDACRRAGLRFLLTGHESSAAWTNHGRSWRVLLDHRSRRNQFDDRRR